ncbi:dihydrodipicolinate synthase family protein [Roseimicrobium sp. ORNL1]|uniref:dihydrodipicolinate synthase family protein n=1 Tax=Roseimicrobium sp. ORNL1 TaxID=2711231 RepID=UPI0013E13454|nr:dihydrodipicolinate synthase family protein [Roseimicrobium sp. ORNL1]QIF04469.1 N-acetylneuraminate lyase [Roseimicrobium sp. ORNL1]
MNLPESQRLLGLTPATHTPFQPDGSLHLDAVEPLAAHLLKWNIGSVFIGGSTGESHSLTLAERNALTERWISVVKGTPLRVIVHVGANCLEDAASLAAHAQQHGAAAISALSPSYFKPRSVDVLISCAARIAAAAPDTPFYHYDIPAMTGVSFSMPEFLSKAAERIPTLAGLKFTNPDLMAYLQCLQMDPGYWDIPWGMDEWMLGALATGARGAVGSSFNFAAPVYQRLMAAFARNDLEAARTEQLRSTQIIATLARHGYMGAAKATMEMLGVPVGPPRLPNSTLDHSQKRVLQSELESLGFFEWLKPE